MKQGNVKRFLDKERLEQMIKLRRKGYAIKSLALMFDVDTSTIRFHLHKYYITNPEEVFNIQRIVEKILPEPLFKAHWEVRDGVRYNLGMSYKEYLEKANTNLLKYAD